MSWQPCPDPAPGDARACDAIEMVIVPRSRDIGDFEVRRALPSAKKRMVGPFIFFDQMGPAEFLVGRGMDVRPHPHIGLATVTYLFTGEIIHKDSLGNDLPIRPGAVNWMTAGSGIAHSERSDAGTRDTTRELFGIQSWVALPARSEEADPGFVHYGADEMPKITGEGKTVQLVAGEMFGKTSPVAAASPTLYADVLLEAGATLPLDPTYEERAIYTVSGEIDIAGDRFAPGSLLVFKPGDRISVTATSDARFMVLGGEPMDGPRHIWWNFVSSSRDRIEQAKEDWKQGRFAKVPGDEAEFIPLPD